MSLCAVDNPEKATI